MSDEIFFEIVRIYKTFNNINNVPLTDGNPGGVWSRTFEFENSYIIRIKELFLIKTRNLQIFDENNKIIISIYNNHYLTEQHWKVFPDKFHFYKPNSVITTSALRDGKPLYINSKLKKDAHFNFSLDNEIASFDNMQIVRKFNSNNYFNSKNLNGFVHFEGYDLEKLKNTRLERLDERDRKRTNTNR